MAAPALPIPQPAAARLCAWSCTLELRTPGAMDFVDLTDRLAACVEHAGIEHGILNAQCLHTSAALLVNENEPLLHEDFRALLARRASGRTVTRTRARWYCARQSASTWSVAGSRSVAGSACSCSSATRPATAACR